jgi:tyrosyl-DNA phosphodiesterase-1
MHKWGHLRLRAALNREAPFPNAFRGAPLAAQYSSLGSLDDMWLTEEFKVSLAAGRCGGGNGGCAALLRCKPSPPRCCGLSLFWLLPYAEAQQQSLLKLCRLLAPPACHAERLGLPAPGAAGLQLVWPSVSEVQNSIEGWKAGMSVPGPAKNVEKPFLQQYYRRHAACTACLPVRRLLLPWLRQRLHWCLEHAD